MVGLILLSISPLCKWMKIYGCIELWTKHCPHPSRCTCNLLYLLSTHLHVQYACILIQEILILVQHCFLYSTACLLWYSNNMRTLDLKWVYFEWEREREMLITGKLLSVKDQLEWRTVFHCLEEESPLALSP